MRTYRDSKGNVTGTSQGGCAGCAALIGALVLVAILAVAVAAFADSFRP